MAPNTNEESVLEGAKSVSIKISSEPESNRISGLIVKSLTE